MDNLMGWTDEELLEKHERKYAKLSYWAYLTPWKKARALLLVCLTLVVSWALSVALLGVGLPAILLGIGVTAGCTIPMIMWVVSDNKRFHIRRLAILSEMVRRGLMAPEQTGYASAIVGAGKPVPLEADAVRYPNLIEASTYTFKKLAPRTGSKPVLAVKHQGKWTWRLTAQPGAGEARVALGDFDRLLFGDFVNAAVSIVAVDPAVNEGKARVVLAQFGPDGEIEAARVSKMVSTHRGVAEERRISFDAVPLNPLTRFVRLTIGVTSGDSVRERHLYFRDPLVCGGESSVWRPPLGTVVEEKTSVVHISPDGNDETGDGSTRAPFKTPNRALHAIRGQGTILADTGVYESSIDVQLVRDVKLIGGASRSFERTVFRFGHRLTQVEAVGTHSRVWRAPCPEEWLMIDQRTGMRRRPNWIWLDAIPDANTLIPTEEHHALTRGMPHRLPSTKLWQTIAPSIEVGALDEMETSTSLPMCHWEDGIIYFTIPDGCDAEHAHRSVYVPQLDGLFGNHPRFKDIVGRLEVTGVDVLYGSLDASGFREFKARDVRSYGAANAGIDVGWWVEAYDCVAGGAGSLAARGDGFNAHHFAVARHENCYFHDNHDDGESCHSNCSVVGIGSIAEYNIGQGFCPAQGCQAVYHNCLSRKNSVNARMSTGKWGGFCACGTKLASDPGVVTTTEVYNCISIGDRYGFYDQPSSSAYLKAFSCQAIDPVVAEHACTLFIRWPEDFDRNLATGIRDSHDLLDREGLQVEP